MTESNSTLILEGLVECGPCGRKMVTVHDPENRYACPVILQNGPDDCPTPPVTVEQLDTEAARWLAEKTLTERQLGQITREIMDNHAALRGPSEKDLEKARKGLGKQEKDRRRLMELVESGRTTFRKAEERLSRLNERRQKLLEQADRAQKEIQLWELMGREAMIREAAMDLQTYLAPCARGLVQQLMEQLLDRVVVGPEDITFRHGRDGPPGGESRISR